tara:strand:+ start:815 stop:1477 length:663 start_codon:yes stop_codon:yes gene_type:complete
MSEVTQEVAGKVEAESVTMSDGRVVAFAGKRKVIKSTVVDESKVTLDGGQLMLDEGAVSIRMDFRNGETRLLAVPLSLVARTTGHGAEQKFGDELASPASDPMSLEDMVIAIDDLYAEFGKGNWGKARAAGGGGASGASLVIQAIMEASGKDLATVKAFLDGKMAKEALKPEGERISKRALYDSFKAEGTATGAIFKRMEAEKGKKAPKVDADAALAELG